MLEHMAELTIDPASEGDRTFYSVCSMSVWVIPCVPGSWSEVQPLGGGWRFIHFSISFTPRGVCAPQHPQASFRCHLNSRIILIYKPLQLLIVVSLPQLHWFNLGVFIVFFCGFRRAPSQQKELSLNLACCDKQAS